TGSFAFANSWPLWMLAAAILVGFALIGVSLFRRRALGWRLIVPIGFLQALFVAALAVLLWRPVLNVERVRDRENVLAVALDASASMALPDDAEQGKRSRLQRAVAALEADVLQPLSNVFELRLFSFSDTVTSLSSLAAVPPPGPQTRVAGPVRTRAGTEIAAGSIEVKRAEIAS